MHYSNYTQLQWNLYLTATSMIKFVTCDFVSYVFFLMMTEGTNLLVLTISAFWSPYERQKADKSPIRWSL